LLGLAAGDRNGGPIELAVRFSESLAERGAFDTGTVAAMVLEQVACGVPVDKAVAQADRDLGGQTAGCDPAHRAAPLAMAAFMADETVGDCAAQEAALTHAHPLAGYVAAAVAVLCRALVQGYGWGAALRLAARGRLPRPKRSTAHPDFPLSFRWARRSVLCQWHLNSTSACASDLNRTMPFCFALITSMVLPLSAQNSDASFNAAALTPKPVLSKPISDLEMR